MRKDLGFEFCNTVSDRNPMIAAPLRKTDCSLVSDGAAAVMLMSANKARSLGLPVLAKIAAYANAGVDPAITGEPPEEQAARERAPVEPDG